MKNRLRLSGFMMRSKPTQCVAIQRNKAGLIPSASLELLMRLTCLPMRSVRMFYL